MYTRRNRLHDLVSRGWCLPGDGGSSFGTSGISKRGDEGKREEDKTFAKYDRKRRREREVGEERRSVKEGMIKRARRIIIKRQGGKIMYGVVLASIHAFYSLGD